MAKYNIGQYQWTHDQDPNQCMTLLTDGRAVLKKGAEDIGVTSPNTQLTFDEQAVTIPGMSFKQGQSYFFHGKIKRLPEEQFFTIKLFHYEEGNKGFVNANLEQFIKTISIQGGAAEEWVDIEFTFTPLLDNTFNAIVFQLKREFIDYTSPRVPIIYYQELSQLKNIITDKKELLKIGVQGIPGFLMCINGEEIHIGKLGLYEIYNGLVTINSFVPIHAAADNDEDFYKSIQSSACGFAKPKTRVIPDFVLDYMY